MPELAARACSKSRRDHSALLARRSREVAGALELPSHLRSFAGSVAARPALFWNRAGRGRVGTTTREGKLALVWGANAVGSGASEGGATRRHSGDSSRRAWAAASSSGDRGGGMAGPLEPFIPRGRPERVLEGRHSGQRQDFVTWANTQTVALGVDFPREAVLTRGRENAARALPLREPHAHYRALSGELGA